LAAGKILAAKLTEVRTHAEPATGGDVNGIHDLRVAVKRLREAMRLFRRLMPAGRRRLFLPLVEQLNDALGPVRDRDVWAERIAWLMEQAPAASDFLEGLRGKWAEEREGYLTEAIGLWESLTGTDRLLEGLSNLAAAVRKRRSPENSQPLDRFAYVTVTERALRVRQRLAEPQGLADPATLHALRITVKRLKYSLEPFLTALPGLEQPYQAVADVQEAVGLTHDFDVIQAALEEHYRQTAPGCRRGARHALDVIRAHRAELFAQAGEPLKALASDDWQRRLLDSLD
jgi:CHAD domain-containing protein